MRAFMSDSCLCSAGLQDEDDRDNWTHRDSTLPVVVPVVVVVLFLFLVVLLLSVLYFRRCSRLPKYNLPAETEKA